MFSLFSATLSILGSLGIQNMCNADQYFRNNHSQSNMGMFHVDHIDLEPD